MIDKFLRALTTTRGLYENDIIWLHIYAKHSFKNFLADGTGNGEQVHNGFSIQGVIAPLGITTLILLISTFALDFSLPKYSKKHPLP